MTQEEILAMLHNIIAGKQEWTTWTVSTPHLVMLVNKAIEAEREACAKTVEKIETYEKIEKDCFKFAAKKIRARGQV